MFYRFLSIVYDHIGAPQLTQCWCSMHCHMQQTSGKVMLHTLLMAHGMLMSKCRGHLTRPATRICYKVTWLLTPLAVNPGHWTVEMRDDALEPAKLDDPALKVPLLCVLSYSRRL